MTVHLRLITVLSLTAGAVWCQTAPIDSTGGGQARTATAGTSKVLPLASTDFAKFTKRLDKAASVIQSTASVSLLGSVLTASPAESFALNGNLAYVCDDNEISVINVANPSSLQVVSTAVSNLIQNSGNIHCAVQRNTLSVFADQAGSLIAGGGPGFIAFSLTNPLQPQLINATSLNKRFFQDPAYIGNFAFVPTSAIVFFFGWDNQLGDLLAVDLTNFSSPVLAGVLEQPVSVQNFGTSLGGSTIVSGATQADASILYLGGSTSTGNQNNGVGRLQIADVTNPAAMKVVGQLLVPGSIHFAAPLIQGTVAVGIGNSGGFVGAQVNPIDKGNIVVTAFDVSDRRAPAILSISNTSYKVGVGGGATRIGSLLFAFAGVVDANNNPVLLVVDANNPLAPVIQSIPIPQAFTSMQAVGTTLFATLGSGGFAAYSIPGIGTVPTSTCPAFVDAVVAVDRGANIPGQAFLSAMGSLKTFVDSLHLPADQAGAVTFTNSAILAQTLTSNTSTAKAVFDNIIPGGTSYIGAGIAAAQAELTSSRHNPSATQIMVIVSDGADTGAPSSSATQAAATAAKAAGIRIISVQYGSSPSALMQSIATSSADFYLVTP